MTKIKVFLEYMQIARSRSTITSAEFDQSLGCFAMYSAVSSDAVGRQQISRLEWMHRLIGACTVLSMPT